jgi:alpha-L-fucosidase
MSDFSVDRRGLMLAAAAAPAILAASPASSQPPPGRDPSGNAPTPDQQRRMKWWHDAKFGMFIHFGLYAAHGRHEWAMEMEAIPVAEYQKFTAGFNPAPGTPRKWAQLAKAAGMKYMVLTSKHHEGFCNWDTKLTNYNAMQFGPKRDVIREYVEAARAEGLRVGFYYSLMDWHHPDGARCESDPAARRRFVDYTHGLIRELMTNYGKIDVLWYDVSWPLDAEGWESEKMNQMVLELQPEIIVNNRNLVPGDFSTPEQSTQATQGDWESCMTMNDSWGYVTGDNNWKSPNKLVQNLVECARDGGNYLLNIGPKADGSVPEPSIRILGEIGQWLEKNGAAIYNTDKCLFLHGDICGFTRKKNTLFTHVYFWPGETVTVGGVTTRVRTAKLLATGKDVLFTQKGRQLIFSELPAQAPDTPVTVIMAECESEPVQHALSSRVDIT